MRPRNRARMCLRPPGVKHHMAKQFYSINEAAKALNCSEEQLKAMVREGKLREYRDAGKVNYRVDDVNRLAAKEGSSVVDLALGDAEPSPAMDLSSSDVIKLQTADDEPAPRKPKEDTKISSVGINVFDDEELQIDADPLAETRITAAVGDQVPLGGVGSGSGLMDLTRESDDTSLGAELLDVISPTEGGETETVPRAAAEVQETMTAPPAAAAEAESYDMNLGSPISAPVYAGPADPAGPVFTGLMVASAILLAFVGFAATAALQGVLPGFMAAIGSGANLYMYVLGGGAVLAGLGALVGFLVGRSGGPSKRPAVR